MKENLRNNQIGSKNSNWKGGIDQSYYRKFLKEMCELCKINKATVVHHKDRDRVNNEQINLQSLCGKCHANIHKNKSKRKAVVCLSGGLDSATSLAWAIKNFNEVETLSFDYNQKHKIELNCAKKLSELAGVNNTILKVETFNQIRNKSSLVNFNTNISSEINNLPSSFLPGRNIIFVTYAASFAYEKGFKHIVLGVCKEDANGYPDCRPNTIYNLQKTLRKALETDLYIHTPIINISKSETIKLMESLGKLDWYRNTHTCYNGLFPPCGKCPSCLTRKKGFEAYGIVDPLNEQK